MFLIILPLPLINFLIVVNHDAESLFPSVYDFPIVGGLLVVFGVEMRRFQQSLKRKGGIDGLILCEKLEGILLDLLGIGAECKVFDGFFTN